MVVINQDRGICIMAQKRYGKTYLMRAIIRELIGKYQIVLVNTDLEDEFNEFVPNSSFGDLRLPLDKIGDLKYLNLVLATIRSKMNNFILCITDLDKYYEDTNTLSKASSEIKDLYGTGGHQRILPIIETKMPAFIPKKTIMNNNLFYIGQYRDATNLQLLKNYATKDEIRNLVKPQFIEIDMWTNKRNVVEVKDNELTIIKELPEL